MLDWRVILELLFMAFVLIGSLFSLFIKSGSTKERMDIKSIPIIHKLLLFGALNSFMAGRIFELEWMYWITLYSGIILLISSNSTSKKAKSVLAILLIIVITSIRVPADDGSFEQHISKKHMYQCVHSLECVKVSSAITPEDTLETVIEVFHVRGSSYNYYGLFAKGSYTLKSSNGNMEKYNGINIAGFWLNRKTTKCIPR